MPHFIQALRNIFSAHPKLRRRKSKNARAEQLETRELLAATVIDTNFNSGTSEVSLTGTAFYRSSNTDVVLTQQGIRNQQGSLIVNSTGTARYSFTAQIRAYVGGDATGADGYSFGYGSIPSGAVFGEGGLASGVWISVDTYINTPSNGAIRAYYNGSLLREDLFTGTSRSLLAPDGRRYLNFAVTESGLLTYSHDNLSQRSIQLTGWNPQSNWRYGVGARTGDETDVHVVDELHIFDNTEAPTNLSLSATTVNENASGTTVGTLSTTDAGGSTSFTYSLVSGTGSTNNSSFQIVGNQLRTATGLNYEAGATRSVRLRTTDQAGLSFERAFTIFVTNLNEAPTDISLSGTTVSENQPAGTTVGSFSTSDPDSGNTFTYSLVSGTGSTDNASFQIIGNSLRTSTSLNFEAGSTRSVRVRTSDQNGLTYDRAFTITVSNVNEAPTDITLSNTSVAENQPIGTAVGSISTVDPDAGGSFTYQLVSGTGDTDNGQFEILGGELKTKAVLDFETKSDYSIRVRTTDQGGLSFEKIFTISVTDVQEDVTAPQSLIAALPAASSSLTFSLSASAADPGGATASGVFEIDFYYSTGGSFIKFATSPASNPTANFTGSPNTTYWFRSIARDNAGNVEAKTSADTYTRIGDVVPPTTQVTSATHNSGGLFTINMTGSKASGTPMTAFDVYVVIDSNAPVLVGTAGAGAASAGVYSASLLYQGLTDGNSHSYRFYSVGKDSAGNVEAALVSGDVTVTVSFSPGGLTLGAIDVENGSGQRSYVRHLDLLFSSSTGLSSLANTDRVRVERFGIDATSVNSGTGTLVSGFTVNQAGNRLKLDFGATGLGGLRQAGNGFYRVLVDIDGNGNFTDAGDGAMEFHRLFGDADGNGIVDIADTNLVTSQIGRTGTNLDGDLDGNGAVNSTDRLFTVQQRGRKLLDPMLGWLDD